MTDRLLRRASSAHERAANRSETPVGYRMENTYSNPRMMGGRYASPIYKREQELMDRIASVQERRDPLEPSMDPGMFAVEPQGRTKYRRKPLEFLADALSKQNKRGGMGRAQYGGGKSKGLKTGLFGRFDTKQKDYNCRVKGNC